MKLYLHIQLLICIFSSLISFGGFNSISSSMGLQFIKMIGLILPILSVFFCILTNFNSYVIKVFRRIIYFHRYLFLYILYAFIGLLYCADYMFSLVKISVFFLQFISILSVAILYISIYKNNAFYELRHDLLTVIFIASIILLLLFFLNGAQLSRTSRGMFNIPGIQIHANQVSAFIGISLFIVFWCAGPIWHKFNAYVWCSISIQFILFLIAFSRGGFLALLSGIIMAVFLPNLINKSPKLVPILAASFFLSIVSSIFLDDIYSLVSRSGDSSDIYTMTGRSKIWNTILTEMEWPDYIFGFGYGAISKDVSIAMEWVSIRGAHNFLIQILTGNGIIGLFLFILYFIGVFKKSFQVDTQFGVACGAWVYFFIHGMSEHLVGVNLSASFLLLILFNIIIALKPIKI